MTTYTFDVTIDGFDMDNPRHHAALENLPFWVYPSESDGEVTASITIDSASPAQAIVGARRLLDRINFPMRRIDLGLVGVSGIAEELGCSREAVRLYATGARRSGFPTHWAVIGGTKVWAWADVCEWAISEKIIAIDDLGGAIPIPSRVAERVNGAFAQTRSHPSDGWDGVARKRGSVTAPDAAPGRQMADMAELVVKGVNLDAFGFSIPLATGGLPRLPFETVAKAHGH